MSVNPHAIGGLHLGQVTDNDDPDSRGRIKVQIVTIGLELWCQTTSASAGDGYGVSLLPKLDELVVVAFVGAEFPVVLGALWSGQGQQPENAAPVEDNYLIKTPGGTELRMDDSTPSLEIKTGSGYRVSIDDNAGEIIIERDAQSITLSSSSIDIRSSSQVNIDASTINLTASTVNIQAGTTQASGVVQCAQLTTSAVVSSSYTPGAGNIW